jgi:hypothetical protein
LILGSWTCRHMACRDCRTMPPLFLVSCDAPPAVHTPGVCTCTAAHAALHAQSRLERRGASFWGRDRRGSPPEHGDVRCTCTAARAALHAQSARTALPSSALGPCHTPSRHPLSRPRALDYPLSRPHLNSLGWTTILSFVLVPRVILSLTLSPRVTLSLPHAHAPPSPLPLYPL